MTAVTGFIAPAIPVAYLSISIAVYALGFLAPRHRWLLLAPMVGFQCLTLATADHWPEHGLDSLWGLLAVIWISHSLSVWFLERSLFDELEIDSKARNQPWYWKAWKTWNNPRLLGTCREERVNRKVMHRRQSRPRFVILRSAKVALYWLVSHYIQPLLLPGAFAPFDATDFDPIRQTYFRRILSPRPEITARETALRAIFAVFWGWGAYALVDGAHSALSVVFVGILRVDAPHEWPPIFGDLREARSLRGFWGRFWHRLVVRPYGNVGRCLAEGCLGLEPGSLGHKVVVAFAIFLLSGVAHAVVAYQLGDRCGWRLDVWWFLANFGASAGESLVWRWTPLRAAVLKCSGKQGRGASSGKSWAMSCLGYLWVYSFFFWSVPKWQYPKVYCLLSGASAPGTADQDAPVV